MGCEELSLIEFELEPGFEGPGPHTHEDHVDSFYVLDGEAEFLLGDQSLLLGAGSLVRAGWRPARGLALAYVRVEVPDGAEIAVGELHARLH